MSVATRQFCGFLSLLAVLSCSSGGPTTPPAVASITLSQTSATLAPGGTVLLTGTAFDAAGIAISGQTIGWSTSALAVATVNTSGLVTAVAAGTATIAAAAGGKSAQATITVALPVASVTLSQGTATLVPTATVQLTAVPKDAAGATVPGQTIAWTTSSPAVASVSSTGLITALAVGASTITATVGGKSATAQITVQAGAVIGALGGTVSSADGNATVVIPAGALSANTSISITPSTTVPTQPIPVGTSYDLSPSGTQFSAPVTVRLKYTPTLVPTGHAQGVLQMRTLVGAVWTPVAGAVIDSVAHTVTATTTHFSIYIATDVPLAFGLRDGDAFSAVKASSASITICLGDTKRVAILFYDSGLRAFPVALSWGPGPGYAWGSGEGANPSLVVDAITIEGVALGGPNDMIVTVNGETATLHITVVPCGEPVFSYTRDVGGLDNVMLYRNTAASALTTDNSSHGPSTIQTGLGVNYLYRSGSLNATGYVGIYPGLRGSLLATPYYTTSNSLEGFNWVTTTQLEFAEINSTTGLGSLFRINLDGSGKAPFAAAATAGGTARQPFLAGNGFTYFGFASSTSNPTQLYRVDANGDNKTALVPVSGWASTPTVSQDGQWLAMSVLNLAFTASPIFLYDLNNPLATPIAVSPAAGGSYFPVFCGNGIIYYTYSTNVFSGPWTMYRWDMVSRTSTPVVFVGSGSFPEGVSIQPQKGITDRACPK